MFSIAICDDDEIICTQIEKYLRIYTDRQKVSTEVYYHAEKLYDDMRNGTYYDLIFLDIAFNDMNGVELGEKIRNELKDEKTQIVYISSYEEYAMELFEVRPMNFVIKPITEKVILDNVRKAMELSDIRGGCFAFRTRGRSMRIPFSDIIFIESHERKIIVHTMRAEYELYEKLDNVHQQIPVNFIRIHKSYIINYDHVVRWQYENVSLSNGADLPISRSYRRAVREGLLKG